MERLRQLDIRVAEECRVEIAFDDRPVGWLYPDCFVEDNVVVELKAFSHLLTAEEVAQVLTYLAATGSPVGLLFNFGRRRLQFKRVFPPRKLQVWQNSIERYVWRPAETRDWHDDDAA